MRQRASSVRAGLPGLALSGLALVGLALAGLALAGLALAGRRLLGHRTARPAPPPSGGHTRSPQLPRSGPAGAWSEQRMRQARPAPMPDG